MQAVGGTRTAIYMCVTPLVAVVAAWILLGEHARPLQGVGAVLIIAGVLADAVDGPAIAGLTTPSSRAPPAAHRPPEMRDHDAPAYDQADREDLQELLAR